MKSLRILVILAGITVAAPAAAQHLANLTTPYSTRGACESAMASFNDDVRDRLVTFFPNLFASEGEAASYITRAFTCELNAANDQWFITDHRADVIASDWYQRRQD